MTPLPPPPASLRTPTARPAPTRRRTAPGTGEIVAPDMVIATEIDRVPTFDTQTDARKHAAAPPAPTRTPGRVPVPTRAAPAPRTTGGFPAPPPRRKTGQRKAVETPTDPDVVVKAPPRRKTLSGAGSAPTRRKTGTGRAVAEGQTAPTAPRRKTGQRRAVEPPADDQTQRTRADQTQRTRADQTQRTRADQTQRTRAPTRGSDDEDLDS